MLSKTTTSLMTNATFRNYSAGTQRYTGQNWTFFTLKKRPVQDSATHATFLKVEQNRTAPRSSARLAFHRCKNGATLVQLQPKQNPFGFAATRQHWNKSERFRSTGFELSSCEAIPLHPVVSSTCPLQELQLSLIFRHSCVQIAGS